MYQRPELRRVPSMASSNYVRLVFSGAKVASSVPEEQASAHPLQFDLPIKRSFTESRLKRMIFGGAAQHIRARRCWSLSLLNVPCIEQCKLALVYRSPANKSGTNCENLFITCATD